jgi:hypothetical protein
MQTIFDPPARDELLRRVDAIQAGSARQRGKMTPSQMLEHTARALEVATGRTTAKQIFIGKVIGRFVLRGVLGEKPLKKNTPTDPAFIVHDAPELESARERVKTLIRDMNAAGAKGCDGRVHSFFGRMTGAEWGVLQYKHVDHHLRQFGA